MERHWWRFDWKIKLHIYWVLEVCKTTRSALTAKIVYPPQEGELYRLEHQVQRLETENLRKDVKILQLEKQLQTALYSRTQVRS